MAHFPRRRQLNVCLVQGHDPVGGVADVQLVFRAVVRVKRDLAARPLKGHVPHRAAGAGISAQAAGGLSAPGDHKRAGTLHHKHRGHFGKGDDRGVGAVVFAGTLVGEKADGAVSALLQRRLRRRHGVGIGFQGLVDGNSISLKSFSRVGSLESFSHSTCCSFIVTSASSAAYSAAFSNGIWLNVS